jgi:phage-related protein
VLERADILDKVETEHGLYELRLANTPNNPRILLCCARGRRIVLLHAFKKKGRRLPAREVEVAKGRRDMWVSRYGGLG